MTHDQLQRVLRVRRRLLAEVPCRSVHDQRQLEFLSALVLLDTHLAISMSEEIDQAVDAVLNRIEPLLPET